MAERRVQGQLGHALLRAAPLTGPRPAAEATAALALDLRAPGADLEALVASVRDGRHPEAGRWRREADRLERLARRHAHHSLETRAPGEPGPEATAAARRHPAGLVSALAFPAWIARRAGEAGAYLLASGTLSLIHI